MQWWWGGGEHPVSMTTSSFVSRSSHHPLLLLLYKKQNSQSLPGRLGVTEECCDFSGRGQVPSGSVGNATGTACSVCGWMCALVGGRPCLALWLLVSGWLHFTHLENTEHSQKLHWEKKSLCRPWKHVTGTHTMEWLGGGAWMQPSHALRVDHTVMYPHFQDLFSVQFLIPPSMHKQKWTVGKPAWVQGYQLIHAYKDPPLQAQSKICKKTHPLISDFTHF